MRSLPVTGALLLLFMLPAQILPAADDPPLPPAQPDPQTVVPNPENLESAISRLKTFLYSRQSPRGDWEQEEEADTHLGLQYGGTTALVTYALLASGESHQHPGLEKAIDWLENKKLRGTYAIALRAHVWSSLPDRFLPLLKRDARWLEEAAHPVTTGGLAFDYTQGLDGWSNSRTQYALLGLWEAEKRGISVSDVLWRGLEKHLLASQEPDGGFIYNHTFLKEASAGMTAAGLTGLYVVRDQAHLADYHELSGARQEKRLEKAIQSGLAYLQTHFQPHVDHGPRGDAFLAYYLYGIERVGLASGLRYLNGRDWFQEGAGLILSRLTEEGGARISTDRGFIGDLQDSAFALLFLSRGRHPLLLQKLEIPAARWNNRPRDAAQLAQWMSSTMEKDLGWARLPIDAPSEAWGMAPMIYLASDEPVAFNLLQRQHLKYFLDQGGLLVTSADGGNQRFTQSLEKLMHELFPDLSYQPIDPSDRLLTQPWRVKADKLQARSLHNGVRHLALHFEEDLSWLLHAARHQNPAPWACLLNACFHITEGKPWINPGPAPHAESGQSPDPAISIEENLPVFTLVLGRHEGVWNSEPAAWPALADSLRSRMNLQILTLGLDELDQAPAGSLLVISGTDALRITLVQSLALKQFMSQGGTVLFENAGGMGRFAESSQAFLRALYPQSRFRKIPLDSPLLSGESFDGHNLVPTGYRTFAVLRSGAQTTPRLLELPVHSGTPRLFVSPDDLSQALTGRNCWGVYGYDTPSARKIMENLLKFARHSASE